MIPRLCRIAIAKHMLVVKGVDTIYKSAHLGLVTRIVKNINTSYSPVCW
jgi:hypothetical protein